MKHYYTDKQYKELLSHMVILVDTREQSNQHILDYFDENGIKYKKKAQKTGDYGLMIEACSELGFAIDTYFSDELCIERKYKVNELAGNIANSSKDDNRLFKELNRMLNIDNNYLIIEDDSMGAILNGDYKSKLNADSLLRTLLTWQKRNKMHIYFTKKEETGKLIYELCKNCLDNSILK